MDVQRYKDKTGCIDWIDFYLCNDINLLNSMFEDRVLKFFEEEAPLNIFQSRHNYKNWLGDELKNYMRMRDMKREQARLSGDNDHWKQYRVMRNSCTKKIKTKKNNTTVTSIGHLRRNMTLKAFLEPQKTC